VNLDELMQTYESQRPDLETLAQSARYLLRSNLEQKKIKVHELIHRIKELDSLRDKAERQGSKVPFRDIRDLIGLRVVCLFRSDVPKVLDIIRKSFEIVEEENKVDESEKQVFDYMAVHVIARMKLVENTSLQSIALPKIPFEIQVRTIGQDAWASLSHHLAYKQEASFPPDHFRDLYALSALFYVADTQFEQLRTACTQSLANKKMHTL